MRSIIAMTLLAAALAATGCTATVAADAYGPDLVYVSPGVQVVADYDEPIFYSEGLYWRYYGGTWYRSPRYTGGWVYASPPAAVLHIDRPHRYVHYRPSGWAGRPPRYASPPPPASAPARGWRGGPPQPVQSYRGAPPPRPQAYPAPAAPQRPHQGTTPAPSRSRQSGGWRGQQPGGR